MDRHDGTEDGGRRGVAYDWQSLYVAAQVHELDADLAELLSTAAPSA
jgi:hypothetical protein